MRFVILNGGRDSNAYYPHPWPLSFGEGKQLHPCVLSEAFLCTPSAGGNLKKLWVSLGFSAKLCGINRSQIG